MKHLFTLLFATFFLSALVSMADPIDSTQALIVAQRFYYSKSQLPQARQAALSFRLDDKKPFYISNAKARLGAAEFLYYVFNVGNNDGFVIISGDDAATPIIGYSTTGHFETKNQPEHLFKWMWNYKRQLQGIKDARLKPTSEITKAWLEIKTGNRLARESATSGVAPLLQTIWNQSPYYNDQCPKDINGQRSVTGCTSTAMAQIMKYHNHPSHGSGAKGYNHLTTGEYIYANFDTDYDWSNMPNELNSSSSSAAKYAVEKLMYHCGISINTDYHSIPNNGSSAEPSKVVDALKNNFYYSNSAKLVRKSDFTDATWVQKLRNELDSKRPIHYSGFGGKSGHSFVCDGYDGNLFSFNWGWGGESNGFFTIDGLDPEKKGIGAGDGVYNDNQIAIIGITPDYAKTQNTAYTLQLYKPIQVSLAGRVMTASLNIANTGSSSFSGDYAVALYDNQGQFYDFIHINKNNTLDPNKAYVNNLTFTDNEFYVPPGTYKALALYREIGYTDDNAGWKAVNSTATNKNPAVIEFTNAGAKNDIQLFGSITASLNPIQSGQPLSVSLYLKNTSQTTPFKGDYLIDLYTLKGQYVTNVATKTGQNLAPNNYYVNGLTFTNNQLNAEPGTYLLAASTRSPDGLRQFIDPKTDYNWNNPVKVTVVEAPLYADNYESNDTEATAYKMDTNKPVFTSGTNLHTGADLDYYQFKFDPGVTYVITARVHDKASSTAGRYTADVILSYKIGANWSKVFDDVITDTLVFRNGGTMTLLIAPLFAGITGTYGLDVQVTPLIKPQITVQGSPTVCEGTGTINLSTASGNEILWYKDDKVLPATTTSLAVNTSGTYTVATRFNGILSQLSDPVVIAFKSTSPAPTVPATPITYCIGDVAQPLSATGTQLQWYTQATGGTGSAIVPTFSTATAKTLTYYVTQTSSGSCESVRQPVIVAVTALPGAPGVVANQFVCQYGKPVPLTAQGQNLIWRVTSGTATSETAPAPATDKVDTLRYTVTQRAGSCVSPAAVITVTVRKAPAPPAVITPAAICLNATVSPLVVTGTAIKWYTKADRSSQATSTFVPPTDKDGQFTYYATQTDANNCESLTNPVTVTVRPKPTAMLPNDTTIFHYDSLAVRIALTGDAPWQLTLWNGRELMASRSPLTVYIKPTATASYALQSVSNSCGTGSTGRTMRITLIEPLGVSLTQPDDLWLHAYPTPTEGSLNVEWGAPAGQSATLQLITLTGQIIWQRPVRSTGVQQTELLQLHSRPGGHYILQLTTPKGVLTRQIIKQ